MSVGYKYAFQVSDVRNKISDQKYCPKTRHSWGKTAFKPGVISMLCMAVPKDISVKGRAFPISIGTSVPKTMLYPIIAPLGCKIYLFSPFP